MILYYIYDIIFNQFWTKSVPEFDLFGLSIEVLELFDLDRNSNIIQRYTLI